MSYLLVKSLHTITAIATLAGFILRGYWMLRRSPNLQHRFTRIAPHVVDTVFLVSGIAMILMLGLKPLAEPWLLAKFAGLIVYILLGTIAIKRGPTMQMRVVAFASALAVFAYVIGVAVAKSPASWIQLLSA